MPEFLVRLHEPPSGVRRLQVQAEHAGAVAQVLGVAPARLLDVQPLAAARPAFRLRTPRLALRLFAQELAVLLDAGIPLLEALQTLREKDRHAAVLEGVIAALRQGQPLSATLAQAGAPFDTLFIALVAASERSGQLAATLRHHAAYLAWTEALRARLQAAAIYPLMLMGAGGAVVLFLLLFVLPRFAGVFDGLGRDLPAASAALMQLGVVAAAHPRLSLLLALALPLLAGLAWRWPPLRERAAALLWASPGIGERLRTVALARLYRCVGLLAAAGVPVPAALRLAVDVLAAPLQPALRAATAEVAAGQRLSAALKAHGLATPVAQRMLRVGESSGQLAAMLERAAAFHDDEIAQLSELVTRVLNPALMLVMGVLIGGIVVLMYLPIFTLMEQVQ
jgi:general secretion pathway protein F